MAQICSCDRGRRWLEQRQTKRRHGTVDRMPAAGPLVKQLGPIRVHLGSRAAEVGTLRAPSERHRPAAKRLRVGACPRRLRSRGRAGLIRHALWLCSDIDVHGRERPSQLIHRFRAFLPERSSDRRGGCYRGIASIENARRAASVAAARSRSRNACARSRLTSCARLCGWGARTRLRYWAWNRSVLPRILTQ